MAGAWLLAARQAVSPSVATEQLLSVTLQTETARALPEDASALGPLIRNLLAAVSLFRSSVSGGRLVLVFALLRTLACHPSAAGFSCDALSRFLRFLPEVPRWPLWLLTLTDPLNKFLNSLWSFSKTLVILGLSTS